MEIPEKYTKTEWEAECYIHYENIVKTLTGEGDIFEKIGRIQADIFMFDEIMRR